MYKESRKPDCVADHVTSASNTNPAVVELAPTTTNTKMAAIGASVAPSQRSAVRDSKCAAIFCLTGIISARRS